MSPRRLGPVIVGVAALLAGLLHAPPAAAAEADIQALSCDGPGYTTFGPASFTAAIVGAVTLGDHAYVVTRGLKPPVIAAVDLASRQVTWEAPLPDGPKVGEPEGAWATVASGGYIYIGTYPVPDLYRFDPVSGEVKHLYSFGNNGGFVWSLTASPDGRIYAGTYPDGRVWEYTPSTGAVRNFGVLATGERYVRAIDADATTVYAGLLDKGKLVAITVADGTKRELVQSTTGFGAVAQHGDRVLATSGGTLFDVAKDGTDLRRISLGGLSADAIGIASDGTAYLSTRPNGTIFRYRTGDTGIAELGTPRLGEETRRLVPQGDSLLGFSGSGGMWSMDLSTAEVQYTDLMEAGLTPGAERPQAILLDNNDALYVAGHFSLTIRDQRTGGERRIWVPGEPKALAQRGNKIYAAIYPSGQILEIDTRTDALRSLGYLGHGQQRPWDLEYDPVTDKLLVATAPLGANLRGALSIVDPDTGEAEVYVNVIPEQSLMSLSLDAEAGIVYLGGDVLGGGGTPPLKTSASVAAFDLATRSVLWQADPVPGYRTFQDVKVHDGVLYGVYKRTASWFAMDLATRTVTNSGPLAGYGEIEVHRGRVFTSTYFGTGQVHLLGTSATLLASGLGDEWYTNPQLAFIPGSWDAWALVGRDLARIRLDPRCPAWTPAP